jgi:hypothetical protein
MEKNTETKTLTLTPQEWFLIEMALEEHAIRLRNRFDDREEYLHPALPYEILLQKLLEIPF